VVCPQEGQGAVAAVMLGVESSSTPACGDTADAIASRLLSHRHHHHHSGRGRGRGRGGAATGVGGGHTITSHSGQAEGRPRPGTPTQSRRWNSSTHSSSSGSSSGSRGSSSQDGRLIAPRARTPTYNRRPMHSSRGGGREGEAPPRSRTPTYNRRPMQKGTGGGSASATGGSKTGTTCPTRPSRVQPKEGEGSRGKTNTSSSIAGSSMGVPAKDPPEEVTCSTNCCRNLQLTVGNCLCPCLCLCLCHHSMASLYPLVLQRSHMHPVSPIMWVFVCGVDGECCHCEQPTCPRARCKEASP
jgi:hypothetical protein